MNHSAREANLVTAAAVLVCGIACAGAIDPDVDRWANVGFGVLSGLAVLAFAVAAVRRELRIRRRLAAITAPTPQEVPL